MLWEDAGDNCLIAFLARSLRNPIQRDEGGRMKVDRIPQVGGLGVLDLLFVGVFRDFDIWERRASIPILTLLQGEF